MLHVFFGTDVVKVRKSAHDFLVSLPGGAEAQYITAETYVDGVLADVVGASSLFGEKQAILIDTPSELAEMKEAVWDMLPELAASENEFVLIESKLLAADQKKLKTHAAHVEEFTETKAEAFNAFALADALANKDKKTLWILLVRAKQNGQSAEQLIGMLFWQLKALRLAAVTQSPEEAGQKPFVWNKARRALSKFKEGELAQLSRDVLAIYHDGHLGKRDADIALEQWVLGL